MRARKIPDVVIRRLPLYLRVLETIDVDVREGLISSFELGEKAGVSAAQVRKDLTLFGEFGKQGVGYEIQFLKEELRRVLHLDREVPVGLIGAGSLGMALARYNMGRYALEKEYRFKMVALFDTDETKIGKKVGKIEVFPVSKLAEKTGDLGIRMVIVSVPAEVAQEAVNRCVSAGIKTILNFAPTKVVVPSDVRLHSADLSLELLHLAYYLP